MRCGVSIPRDLWVTLPALAALLPAIAALLPIPQCSNGRDPRSQVPSGTIPSGGGYGGPSSLALCELASSRAAGGSFYGGFVRMRPELWGREETCETIRALWHSWKHKITGARGQVRHGSRTDDVTCLMGGYNTSPLGCNRRVTGAY